MLFGIMRYTPPMPVSRLLLPAVLLFGLYAVPVLAAEQPPRACLSKAEQRAALAAHKAVPLAQAIKTVRRHSRRAELVGARLCRQGETLVYVLTLLPHSGKVFRMTVDAENGDLISAR